MVVVPRPNLFLAHVDPVQRRLADEEVAFLDQFGQVAEEEVEHQRRDVVAVGVGVHEQDDLAVAEALVAELVARPGADDGDEVAEFLVLHHLVRRQVFAVEDFPLQRQHGLVDVVAALLRRAAGRVALDDEQFGVVAVGRFAVGQLARQAQPPTGGRLAFHLGRRRPTGFAGLGGEHDAADDQVGGRLVVVQPGLERRADEVVDGRFEFGVVQLLLGLALEHRLPHEHRQHRDDPLADVLGGNLQPLDRLLGLGVDLAVVLHGLADGGFQAVLVGAAAGGADAVDVGTDRLVGRFRPLKGALDPLAGVALDAEDRLGDGRLLGALDEFGEVLGDAAGVAELGRLAGQLVLEGDLQAGVDERHVFEPALERVRVEPGDLEDAVVRLEVDRRAVAPRRAGLLQLRQRHALGEGLHVLVAVAADGGDQLAGQGVDDRRADPVQAAGVVVAALAVAELAARVQHRQYQFDAGLLVLRVDVGRDAAAVVADRQRVAGLVQRNLDLVGVAVQVLIDGVIDDLPGEVVQPLGVHPADVHRRPLADRLQPFENLNRVGGGVLRGNCAHARLVRKVFGVNSVSLAHYSAWPLRSASFGLRSGRPSTSSQLTSSIGGGVTRTNSTRWRTFSPLPPRAWTLIFSGV